MWSPEHRMDIPVLAGCCQAVGFFLRHETDIFQCFSCVSVILFFFFLIVGDAPNR